ncbi:MAG: gamma-glutamyltransferase [Longimicrobiales bacterium]|jgi:gamma-glutamyltranspeptidase/glutathione hydrolase|nr:gamma-glutamyltransferase [Longimicrobiales bacterium]
MTGRRNIFLVLGALGLLVFGGWSTGAVGPEGLLSSAVEARSQQNGSAVRAPHGMVVSATKLASEAGAEVLRAGGNAIDAAIATGFALAVTSPSNGNIGGGGFMVVRFPSGATTTIDFREKAPLASFPEMWLEDGEYSSQKHHQSHWAVGVPGTVAGFWKAHQLYGHGEWSSLVDPAIGLARDGFPLSESLSGGLKRLIEGRGSRHTGTMTSFAKNGTEAYDEGEILKQPDLARSLGRIASDGHDGFYSGETARLLVAEMERGGGMITMEDLQRYQARERTPVHGSYRGYDIISMPPPSSGGIAIVQMLNILEGFDLRGMGHNSADYIHHLTEAMRRAYRDRATYLADQDFTDVPLHRLTSKEYGAELRADINPRAASVSTASDVAVGYESPETTHYSVVDAQGMAVSVTYTLEAGYGSAITVPGAGFLLNNEMGDFNAGPGITTDRGLIGTNPNLARPEQRMLSSMTPSIVAKDGELVAVVGSPGGRTIINTVLQLILNIVDFDHGIQEAVNAPRIHHQWLPGSVRIEEEGATDEILATLRAMGHEVTLGRGQGRAHSIMVDPKTGDRLGAADPRGADSGASGH